MKIAYDARMAIGAYRGMGRFLRQMVAACPEDIVGFAATGERDASLNLISFGYSFHPLWEQISLPSLMRRHGIELFLAPYNTGPLLIPQDVKLVLIMHDLIYLEPLPLSASLYQNAGRLYRRMICPPIVRRSNLIVTVSNYSKEWISTRLGIDRAKICVIPNSLDQKWFEIARRADAGNSYIFMVSGEAPSKNLRKALEAYARYVQMTDGNSRPLKIAGVRTAFHSSFRSYAARLGIASHIELLGYVPETEMLTLYRNAELLVMPSLMEGFGIPILEAMASGVPVLASSRTALPEVGGQAARYFEPTSASEMATAISELLATPAARAEMSNAGREWVLRFHPKLINIQIELFWERCREITAGTAR